MKNNPDDYFLVTSADIGNSRVVGVCFANPLMRGRSIDDPIELVALNGMMVNKPENDWIIGRLLDSHRDDIFAACRAELARMLSKEYITTED